MLPLKLRGFQPQLACQLSRVICMPLAGDMCCRGIGRKTITVLKKCRKAKRETAYGEKPVPVKTHLRNMVIVPELIGSVVGVYNGKQYINVEIKPETVGHYLAEFSITYKPIKHGRAGMGSKSGSFIPLG